MSLIHAVLQAANRPMDAAAVSRAFKGGEVKDSIDKTVRANLLAVEDEDEVPSTVAEVIQAADDLWASSTAKFSRLARLADEEDDRVRGAFVFAGGAATGRASSYGAQVHNFPRKSAKEPDSIRRAMLRGHDLVPAHGARVTDVDDLGVAREQPVDERSVVVAGAGVHHQTGRLVEHQQVLVLKEDVQRHELGTKGQRLLGGQQLQLQALAQQIQAPTLTRQRVARAGQARTLREHTYAQRMHELVPILRRNLG